MKKITITPNDAIMESISDGVFTVDSEWKVRSFNRAAENITGLRRQEAIGRRCSEVFKSSMCESDCALKETLQSQKPVVNKSCYIIDVDGKRVPITISTAVLKNADGEIIGGAETFRDLTEVEYLKNELKGMNKIGDVISHSPAMRPIFEMLPMVSNSLSTVLIRGETGTGKELLARALHSMSSRANQPFIALNCGALPDNLLESELFGYKKGAFTGADKNKPGRFALASDGTLFLDEIGDISPAMQVRLLRVLQENTYDPLGSVRSESTNARIIAATNRDLASLVKDGLFRQDLFYRINVIVLELPPLRKRKEDIGLLCEHFIHRFNRIQGKDIQGCSPQAMDLLMAHDWPGNIRELENVIERAFVLCNRKVIEVEHFPGELLGYRPSGGRVSKDLVSISQAAEQDSIVKALKRNHYSRAKTAQELGIHKTTLFRKMKILGIKFPEQDGRSK